ncbi:MAG: VaFE repeat-containing surface-anchored protein [Corynebacterium sp.]|nr:VaFE repeat-containing surface-anchored protein [Corynebacterium sp.]
MKIKRWLKGALSAFAAMSVIATSATVVPSGTAHAATKVNVTNQGAKGTGPANLPTTDMQAGQMGFNILDKSTAQQHFPYLWSQRKGDLTIGPAYRVSVDGGSTMLPFYYRATEIVPVGDSPKISWVNQYVEDDGTFEAPGTTDGFSPNAMTTGATVGNTINYDFGTDANLNSQYLGAENNKTGAPTGYAGISVAFYRPTSTGAGYLVCVTPTSFNPDTTWGNLVPMPARFTPQAGYNDRPELGYLVGELYQNAGLQANSGSITNPSSVVSALQTAWNGVVSGTGNATLDGRLTNSDIKAYADSKLGGINGSAPSFSDNSYFLTAVTQTVVQYYLQGVPLENILNSFRLNAIVSGMSVVKSGSSLDSDNAALRNFAKLLIAYIETAREKGVLDQPLPGDITATIAKSTASGGTTTTTFNLGNTSGATELLVRVPSGVTLASPSSSGSATQSADASSGFVKIPTGTTQVTVTYPSSANISADKFLFKKYGTGRVSGKLYSPYASYQYDSASGHWVAIELVSKQMKSNKVTKWAAQTMLMIAGDNKPTTSLATVQVVAPTISTTLNVGGTDSSSSKAVEVKASEAANGLKVKDAVSYTNLTSGTKYSLTSTIMDATSQDSVSSATGVKASNAGNSGSSNVVTTDFTASAATGSQTVDFGTVTNLQPGHKYVIYTTLTEQGKSDVLASANDPTDLAESFSIGEVQSGKLSTTVGVSGDTTRVASDSTPLTVSRQEARTGVQFTDTVKYENLVANTTYAVTGTLRNVTDGVDVKTVTVNQDSGTGNGTWSIDFGVVSGLQVGKTYVVHETAVSTTDVTYPTDSGATTTGKQVVKHEDDNDKAQTVVVDSTAPAAELRTSVSVKDGTSTVATASPDAASNGTGITAQPAVITVNDNNGVSRTVTDKIWYRGLVGNQEYTITGQLMDVTSGTPTEVTGATATTTITPSMESMDDGAVTSLTFDNVNIQPGHTYVVYETATSNGSVTYTDNNGAQQTGNHVVEHKNPSDQAQTVVAYYVNPNALIRTTVTANNIASTEDAPAVTYTANGADTASVPVKDTVTYTGLSTGVQYKVTGTLMQVDSNGVATSTGISKSSTFTPSTTDGTVDVDFGTVTLSGGAKYVVYETVESVSNIDKNGTATQKIVHEDPSDTPQTFLVVKPQDGTIKTKVEVNYTKTATADGTWVGASRADGTELSIPNVTSVYVRDNVSYSGLVPGETYTFTATLKQLDENGTSDTDVASVTRDVKVDAASGTAVVEFDSPVSVSEETRYYVTETAVHKPSSVDTSSTTYSHNDRADKNQTLFVSKSPSISTTVTANNVVSSADNIAVVDVHEKNSVKVVDTVTYNNLDLNKTYTVEGILYRVNGNNIAQIGSGVTASATVTTTNDPNSANGTVDVDFGTRTDLVPGQKYVVYETLKDSDGNEVAKHADLTDQAQSFVLISPAPADSSLKTSVHVDGGYVGTDAAPVVLNTGGSRAVTDVITYSGLIPTAQYNVTGRLMEVDGDGNATAVKNDSGADVTVTKEFEASDTGAGEWTVDFGNVNLEVGKKYVVFEKAESVENVVQDADGNAVKQTLTHENTGDNAQTIVLPVNDGAIGTTVSYTTSAGDTTSAQTNSPLVISPAEALRDYTDEDTYNSRPLDVVDTIKYQDLMPNSEYTFEGLLQKVENGQVVETIGSGRTTITTDGTGNGEAKVTFSGVLLEPGQTYVAFETASSTKVVAQKDGTMSHQIIEHKNPQDAAQTVIVSAIPTPGNMRTVVSVDGSAANIGTPAYVVPNGATATTRLTDTIIYQNLFAGVKYDITGTLMKVEGDVTGPAENLTVTPAVDANGNVITKTITYTPQSTNGIAVLEFGVVTGLEAGARYVVYEHMKSQDRVRPDMPTSTEATTDATSTTGATTTTTTDGSTSETTTGGTTPASPGSYDELKHENPKDEAQTILIQHPATIRTQVQMGSVTAQTATNDSPAAAMTVNPLSDQAYVDVVDNVFYTGLIAGKSYTLTGELMKVNEDGSTELIARHTEDNFVPEAAEGKTTITFANSALQANTKYVVFETLTSKDAIVPDGGKLVQQKLEHKDVNDKAQTIVVNQYVPGVPTTPLTPTTTPWTDPWPYGNELTPPSSTSTEPASPATTTVEGENPWKPFLPFLPLIPLLPIIPALPIWPYNNQPGTPAPSPTPNEPQSPGVSEALQSPAPQPTPSPEAPQTPEKPKGHLAVTGSNVTGLVAVAMILISAGLMFAWRRKND